MGDHSAWFSVTTPITTTKDALKKAGRKMLPHPSRVPSSVGWEQTTYLLLGKGRGRELSADLRLEIQFKKKLVLHRALWPLPPGPYLQTESFEPL